MWSQNPLNQCPSLAHWTNKIFHIFDQSLISDNSHVLSIWKWLDNYWLFLFAHKAVASLQTANIDCAVAISKQCLGKCIRELVCTIYKLFRCRHISAIDAVQGYIGRISNPDWWNLFANINGIWVLDVKEELFKVTYRIVLICCLDNYLEGRNKIMMQTASALWSKSETQGQSVWARESPNSNEESSPRTSWGFYL